VSTVHAFPFCELHVHIEGTLEPETIFAMAARQGRALPYGSAAELGARYQFTSLQSFLDLYYDNMQVLATEADFYELTSAYLRRAEVMGLVHAEIFVDPQAHTTRGLPEHVVLKGVYRAIQDATRKSDLTASIIVCVLRDHPAADAERMLDAVLESGVPVIGLGLDSGEVGNPPSKFRRVFESAAAAGLHRVAHAGEEGPPEYIWQALDELGAQRIDHGVRALEDQALVRRLATERIPLTVCPFSNVRLRVVEHLSELPLREMLDRDLVVTINSDDPAYFGGYLDANIQAAIDTFGFSSDEIRQFAGNSIEASFLADTEKAAFRTRL
jgi:adenosine deaminase